MGELYTFLTVLQAGELWQLQLNLVNCILA